MTDLLGVRPVDQRVIADPQRGDGHDHTGNQGDCYRACLAMLAGTTLEQAPHAARYLSWWRQCRVCVVEAGRRLAQSYRGAHQKRRHGG